MVERRERVTDNDWTSVSPARAETWWCHVFDVIKSSITNQSLMFRVSRFLSKTFPRALALAPLINSIAVPSFSLFDYPKCSSRAYD